MLIPLALLGFFFQDPAVGELIRSLDDDDIRIRRKAADELFSRGRSVEEALWVAIIRGESLEASLGAQEVLSRMGCLNKRAREPARRAPSIRVDTVTDTERRFGNLKDDLPGVDWDR